MKQQEIIDFYVNSSYNFPLTQNQTQLPAYRLQILLAKAGVLKIQDKINYGTKSQKLGGLAEQRFQELVPKAINANKYFQKNNPCFDFVLDHLTIDVKYSSLHINSQRKEYWSIRTTGDQDCIVVFFEKQAGTEMNDPYVLFIPMSFIKEKQTNIHISKNGIWFTSFKVEPNELASIIEDYVKMFVK
jgi:hypothetical protein